MASAILGLGLLAQVLAQSTPDQQTASNTYANALTVRVTYYLQSGYMADGNQTYIGAAACSHWIPLGTQLELTDGWVVTCEDRGNGDQYWHNWIDIWSPSRGWAIANVLNSYGDYTTINTIRWGWNDADTNSN